MRGLAQPRARPCNKVAEGLGLAGCGLKIQFRSSEHRPGISVIIDTKTAEVPQLPIRKGVSIDSK